MPFWVYIIQSESSGRYYCGQSSDPQRRLNQHNDPQYQFTKTTKRFEGPWRLIWTKSYDSRGNAMQEEKSIKKRGIARYLAEI
jgi:putative endonuclease